MARVRDLWWSTGRRGEKHKTAKYGTPGNRWQACWIVDGTEKTRTFPVKAAAEQFVARTVADISRGDYTDVDAGKIRVSAVAVKWMQLREVADGSRVRYESCWRHHVEPVFGDRTVASLKPSEIAAWSVSMAGHRSTRSTALMILSGVLDLAVADGARRDNPARAKVVARPAQAAPIERDWDATRIHRVARCCGEFEVIPLVIAGLGLRECEGFGLRFSDFDFDQMVVHVDRQLVRYGGTVTTKLPKGEKTRVVPLPNGVAELVQRYWHDRPISDPLFMIDGKPILAWKWHRVWLPALAAAGVIPEFTGRNYPPAREHGMHALRHWYSTTLQDAGVSLAGVMEFLGHSRSSMPLAVGTYGHVTEQTREAARQAVDLSLFRLRPVEADGTVTELRLAGARKG